MPVSQVMLWKMVAITAINKVARKQNTQPSLLSRERTKLCWRGQLSLSERASLLHTVVICRAPGQVITHSISFKPHTTLRDKYCYLHITEEEMEVQDSEINLFQITCLVSSFFAFKAYSMGQFEFSGSRC